MGRDYAARGGGRHTRSSKGNGNGRGGLPGWVWLIAGLSAGLAVAAFVYISRPPGPEAERLTSTLGALPEKKSEAEREAARRKKEPVPLPPKEKARFTFYELLPNQEVVVPRDPAQKGAAAPESAGTYFIQVASFKAQGDAERQKASLALLGIESRIETVTIDNKQTYYRVRIGPERNWDRVQLLMGRLDDNGIQGLLVKVQ